MKHEPVVTANAVAATTGILFVVCRVFAGLFPGALFAIGKSWFHGIELTQSNGWNLSASGFLLGIISATITAWLVGYLFAVLYNYFLKK